MLSAAYDKPFSRIVSRPLHSGAGVCHRCRNQIELSFKVLREGLTQIMALKTDAVTDADPQDIEQDFLNDLLQLEKLYAHELLGAKSERRSKVLELVNKTAARLHSETPKD
jgi:hypothetical protein